MRTSDIHNNLAILFLCALLFLQPIHSMPPQELYGETSPSYAIACFISFFIGAVLFGLIHKYCSQPPIIQAEKPTDQNEEIRKLFEAFNAKQEKTTSILTKQNKDIKELHSLHKKTLFLCIVSLSHMNIMGSPDTNNKHSNAISSNFLPNIPALYWQKQYHTQKKLLEKSTENSTSSELRQCLIADNNQNNSVTN